jgi:H+/Cl- antiporter ClcA
MGHWYSTRDPNFIWFFGALFIFLGVWGTFTGTVWARFGRAIYRTEDPRKFWRIVAMHFLCGILLIGYFLYKFYGLPN